MTTDTKSSPSSAESRFEASLLAKARIDSGVQAQLRRALLEDDPSQYPPIFHLVEPHIPNDSTEAVRKAYYLVASLFGLAEKEHDAEELRPRIKLAQAISRYNYKDEAGDDGLSPTERRFLALLDADRDELPYRLRQIVRMLTTGSERISQPLDWAGLLKDLKYWNSSNRSVQTRWAKEFYRTKPNENQPEEETP